MAENHKAGSTKPDESPAKRPRLRLIIQPDEVRRHFQSVLRGNDRSPNAEECKSAALWITSAANWHKLELVPPAERRGALAMRRNSKKLDAALTAKAEQLRALHATLRADFQLMLDEGFGSADFITPLLARIETARAALEELRPVYEVSIWPKRTWKEAAGELQWIFETTMRSVYPDRKFGHSLGGPTVRFVHALLPLVAGARVSEGAIAIELKRSNRGGTKAETQSVPGQRH